MARVFIGVQRYIKGIVGVGVEVVEVVVVEVVDVVVVVIVVVEVIVVVVVMVVVVISLKSKVSTTKNPSFTYHSPLKKPTSSPLLSPSFW